MSETTKVGPLPFTENGLAPESTVNIGSMNSFDVALS